MKRALALLAGLGLLGFAGLAQFSGTWKGEIALLPPSLTYTTLSLTYSVAGWEITSNSKFTSSGFSDQSFDFSGALGPISLKGSMAFDPVNVLYKYTDLSSTFDFAGLSISSGVFHGIYPYAESYFNDAYYPYTFAGVYTDTCQTAPQTDSVLMFYTVKVSAEPVSVTVHLADCCTGIQFYDFILSLKDISLCCGITYDAKLHFTKDGFDYIRFTVDPLVELCCGISMGIKVEFGVDYKMVEPSFSWGGIKNCVTVWGDVQPKEGAVGIGGLDIYGYKIYCELAECNYLEFVHAFDPYTVDYYYLGRKYAIDVFKTYYDEEFWEDEYLKLGFCGAGCCGGTWSVDTSIFFSTQLTDTPFATLFGITRFMVETEVPIMDALSVSLEFGYNVPDKETSLAFGWTFKF